MQTGYSRERNILQFDALKAQEGILHGTTASGFYQGSFDKQKFLRKIAAQTQCNPLLLACANQVHGTRIATARANDSDNEFIRFADSDAIVTDERGVLIAVFTADCVPIFIVDPVTPRVAVVHAGWRGTIARILEKTLDAMLERGSNAREMIVCLGPAIRQSHYEVSEGLAARFAETFPDCRGAVAGRHLDLAAINMHQARRMGIPDERIFDCRLCTFEEREMLESYRRDGKRSGRLASFVMLRP